MLKTNIACVFAICLGLFVAAQAQSPPFPGTFPQGTFTNRAALDASVGCSQATTFLARTTGLSGTETTAYTNLICGMVSDGTWSLMDALYIFATNTTTTAALNLVSTNFTGTVNGTLTFSADHGWTGDGSTGYFDTGFVPATASSPNWTQNSASFGVYNRTNRATAQAYTDIGSGTQVGGPALTFFCISNYTGNLSFIAIDTANGVSTAATNSQGQWICSQTSSTLGSQYKNGNATPIQTNTNATSQNANLSIVVFGRWSGGTAVIDFSADQMSAAFAGGGLTATQASNVASRINGYMTALGINVY